MKMDKLKFILKNYNYRWRYKVIWCLTIFVVLVAIDWITKAVAVMKFNQNYQGDIIGGFLQFNFLVNFGSAYGANSDRLWLTITMATLITVFISGVMVFIKNRFWIHSANIFLAGAFGNLLARAWAPEYQGRTGGVVDFITFNPNLFPSWMPTQIYQYSFNIADLCVNIAVVLLVVCVILLVVKELMISRIKKHDEVYDSWSAMNLKREALDQKIIGDIKQQSWKTQFYLYREWKLNCQINELEFQQMYVGFKLTELRKQTTKNSANKEKRFNQKLTKLANKLTHKQELRSQNASKIIKTN